MTKTYVEVFENGVLKIKLDFTRFLISEETQILRKVQKINISCLTFLV